MTKKVDIEYIIREILMSFQTAGIVSDDNLTTVKLILDMHLLQYHITHEDETALSTDLDQTQFFLEAFLLDMTLRGCTASSIKAYKNDLKNFLVFVDKPLKDITYPDIQRFLAHGKINRKWADTTYNAKLIEIRSFFRYFYEEDMLPTNPAKKLHEAKVERKIGPTINPYQREELKSACEDERELALCDMLYSTGARISELCSLDIKDIDFINMAAIVYGKGRKEREVYFNAPAKLHLERYLASRTDDNPALFVTTRKPFKRMSPASARIALNRIKARDNDIADIKLTPHVFRRTVGTDMINRGAPLELVAEKLGHVQMDTTKQCYAAISKTTVHQAHNKYVQ